MNLHPIQQRQFLVFIDGVQAYFTKVTAPKETRPRSNYNDGEKGLTRKHIGFLELDDVTLSKPFDPAQDKALIQWWEEQKKNPQPVTVTIQPVNTDVEGTPIQGAGTLVLTECVAAEFTYPSVDREADGMAMLEILLVPGAVTYQ